MVLVILSEGNLDSFHSRNIFKLADCCNQGSVGPWTSSWQTAEDLAFQNDLGLEWTEYRNRLTQASVHIRDEEDKLVWTRNKEGGTYIVRMGYKVSFTGPADDSLKW